QTELRFDCEHPERQPGKKGTPTLQRTPTQIQSNKRDNRGLTVNDQVPERRVGRRRHHHKSTIWNRYPERVPCAVYDPRVNNNRRERPEEHGRPVRPCRKRHEHQSGLWRIDRQESVAHRIRHESGLQLILPCSVIQLTGVTGEYQATEGVEMHEVGPFQRANDGAVSWARDSKDQGARPQKERAENGVAPSLLVSNDPEWPGR